MFIPAATTTILPIYVEMVPGILVILFNCPPTQQSGTNEPLSLAKDKEAGWHHRLNGHELE